MNNLYLEINARLIERLDFLQIKPKIILNICACTEIATKKLAHYYPTANIIGLDVTHKTLMQAKKQKGWFSKQYFLCSDAKNLPLKNDTVDFIFSNLPMQTLAHLNVMFTSWYRVLKPNSSILFAILNQEHGIDIHDLGDLLLYNKFSEPVMDLDYINTSLEIIYGHAWKINHLAQLQCSNTEIHIPVSQIKNFNHSE